MISGNNAASVNVQVSVERNQPVKPVSCDHSPNYHSIRMHIIWYQTISINVTLCNQVHVTKAENFPIQQVGFSFN